MAVVAARKAPASRNTRKERLTKKVMACRVAKHIERG
jgi:hypothetical protein